MNPDIQKHSEIALELNTFSQSFKKFASTLSSRDYNLDDSFASLAQLDELCEELQRRNLLKEQEDRLSIEAGLIRYLGATFYKHYPRGIWLDRYELSVSAGAMWLTVDLSRIVEKRLNEPENKMNHFYPAYQQLHDFVVCCESQVTIAQLPHIVKTGVLKTDISPRAHTEIEEMFDSIHTTQGYRHCGNCGKSKCEQRCSACRSVWYCSSGCQKTHWTSHKNKCIRLKQQKAQLQETDPIKDTQ